MIFVKRLKCNGHTRVFAIEKPDAHGWEVREEQDSRVIRTRRYDDWHDVERTRAVFECEVIALQDAGWKES